MDEQYSSGATPPDLASRLEENDLQPHFWLDPQSPTLTGKLSAAPRGPFGTALAAFTGWMLISQLFDWAVRGILAYRANAQVSVSEKGIEIHEQKSLLGRKLQDKTSIITLGNVLSLSREVRFARAGTYAGLFALGLGSFLGMRLFVDGLRVPGLSGSLLMLGLSVVLLGLILDFFLANWLDASRGHCRFVVVTQTGSGLCLTGVEPKRVDAVLGALAKKLAT